MDLSFSNVAAVVGLAFVAAMLVYVAALRTQYRSAQAERERAATSEAALREQESWSRLVFDSSSDLMALHRVEADGRLVYEYINRSLIEFHRVGHSGMDPAAWIGRDLAEVLRHEFGRTEDQIEAVLAPYLEAVRTGQNAVVSQVFGQNADMQYREGVVTPLTDSNGRVSRVFYRGTDVTERHRSERAVRDSNARFVSLLATAPVPIIVTRQRDDVVLAVSDAWEGATGYSRDETLGRNSDELNVWVSEEERNVLIAALRTGRPVHRLRTRFRIKSGEVRTFLYSASLIMWDEYPAVMAFPLDIQPIEDAKVEAQASGERFRQLFELNPFPTIITSIREARIMMVNAAWSAAQGVASDEVTGRLGESVGHWADPEVRQAFLARLKSGERLQAFPARFRRASGEIRDFLSWGELTEWQGEPCTLVTRVDVTDLVRTQARAEASEARLREEQRLSNSMMENTSDLMAIYRIDGDRILISEWNRALRRYYIESVPGIDLDYWMGRPIDAFLREVVGLDETEVATRLLPFRSAAELVQPLAYSTSLPGARGLQHRESLIVPLTSAEGAVTHLFYRAADVTERRNAEQEILHSAERFTRMFTASPVATAIAEFDDGRYLDVNAAWCELTGISRDAAIGRTAAEIGFWADDQARKSGFSSMLERGESVQLEHAFRRRDGRQLQLLISAGPIELEGRRRALAVIQDVTRLAETRALAERLTVQFAGMFDLVPNALAIVRMNDGHLLAVNEAWVRLYGWSREAALDRTAIELGLWVTPADRKTFVNVIARHGRLPPTINRLKSRAGRNVLCLTSAETIEWQGESAILVSHNDITEIDALRRDAQTMGERFEKLFHASPVPTLITRLSDGLVLETNEAYRRANGFSRERLHGGTSENLGMWLDPADRAEFVREIESGSAIHNRRMRFRNGTGEIRDYLYSAVPIDWHGVTAVVSFPVDVTELEQARSEAQASSERFEKLFDLSPVPIVIGSVADGRYYAANAAWLQLHGYALEEIRGQSSLSLGVSDPADRARVVDMLQRSGDVRHIAARFRKKSGEYFDSLFSATFVDWEGERAIVGIPYDVSELEQRVRQRTAALEEANRELEAFSYSVSHDLRAPLRALSSFSGLLAARPAVTQDAEAAGYARRVNAAASRMGTMVDALLHFSRLSRQALTMHPVNLAEQVEAIVTELDQTAPTRHLRWKIGTLPIVRGDPTLLRLVLQNLLDNAAKYTRREESAIIEVDASRGEGETIIRVKDNGTGFDMQYSDKLFGVFERLHTDDEFEGTGIGLANAQRIVQRHGGRIWCEAKPGEGACFYFTLPD